MMMVQPKIIELSIQMKALPSQSTGSCESSDMLGLYHEVFPYASLLSPVF